MARVVGVDVTVRLMGEVAELKQELRTAREELRFLSTALGSVIANVACLQVGLDAVRRRDAPGDTK